MVGVVGAVGVLGVVGIVGVVIAFPLIGSIRTGDIFVGTGCAAWVLCSSYEGTGSSF